ncbi:unnamed protein product [Amoebophrya sp. A25]|nr:unnamed protein product [Amoebophrya sp. A25]|eukprot:GSA25T00001012001.1
MVIPVPLQLLFLIVSVAATTFLSPEDRIMAEIVKSYGTDTAPNRYDLSDPSAPVTVHFGIAVFAVQQLDLVPGTQLLNI